MVEMGLPFPALFASRMQRATSTLYRFRESSGYLYGALLVLGGAALTGLAAQVSFPLPFTPVPVTGQVLAVLATAGLLGRWLGWISQLSYVALGAAGVPWFAPNTGAPPFTEGGWAPLAGVTGGYLVGFVVAAAVVGWILDRGLVERTFPAVLGTLFVGVGVVYALGAVQFSLLLHTSVADTALYAVVPFLPGDVLKAVLAGLVVAGTTPLRTRSPPGETGPARLPRRAPVDLLAAATVVGALWLCLGLVVGGFHASGVLVEYYGLAGAVSTVAVMASVLFRRYLARYGIGGSAGPA